MTNPLRILMASSDELAEQLFREVIEGRGHRLTILNPSQLGMIAAELANMKKGGDRTSADFKRSVDRLTQPLVSQTEASRRVGVSEKTTRRAKIVLESGDQDLIAKVIVMSGVADQEDRERAIREGAVAFYKLPIVSADKIREAVEEAAREELTDHGPL